MAEARAAGAGAVMSRPRREDEAEPQLASCPEQGSYLGPRYKTITILPGQTIVPNYPRSLARGCGPQPDSVP